MAKEIKRIAMLSTHGYFDPIPQLGQTDTGGQVVYVLELAKALARVGYKTDIYTRWFDPERRQTDPVPGYENDVRVIRIKAGPWEFIPKEFIYEHLDELADNMIQYIAEQKLDYDLFHGHYVDAGIVCVDVAKRLKKASYFTPHSLGAWKREQMGGDPEEMEENFNFVHRIAEESRIMKAVNGTTLTSMVQRERVEQLYDMDASQMAIIPPGVDVHRYHPENKEEMLNKGRLPENYVYCLSRLDTNKGHDFLLHAFDLVRKEEKNVKLVIGGGSPKPKEREKKLVEKMHQIISEKGMEKFVTIIGYVPDEEMLNNYQKSLLFVLPSKFEPFGMTTQEAMACGKAVVASQYGGIRNVIEHEINGMLVDPQNAREFADAMLKLIRNKGFRETIGLKAHEIINESYSWEAIAARFVDFFADNSAHLISG